jgi:hypothetical protein
MKLRFPAMDRFPSLVVWKRTGDPIMDAGSQPAGCRFVKAVRVASPKVNRTAWFFFLRSKILSCYSVAGDFRKFITTDLQLIVNWKMNKRSKQSGIPDSLDWYSPILAH